MKANNSTRLKKTPKIIVEKQEATTSIINFQQAKNCYTLNKDSIIINKFSTNSFYKNFKKLKDSTQNFVLKKKKIFNFTLLTLTIVTTIFLTCVTNFVNGTSSVASPNRLIFKRDAKFDKNDLSTKNLDAKTGVYENQIIAEPEIECGYGVVHFRVFTNKGNASAVYVRGQASNPECMFHNTHNVTIDLSKCNVRRKREINPSGVAYQMTVIVQMHPLFVTKGDRAYNVNCFYMERRQDVNVEFGVSDITTQILQQNAMLPTCTYSVHRDSPNGPLVKYTRIGEQLYHVWDCNSKMYQMLLYNCNAIDGNGKEYEIINEKGCSKDKFLMPEITYTADNTKAMAATSAFNFPDRNTMSFSCKIRLCYNNECSAITPPQCDEVTTKSTSDSSLTSQEIDDLSRKTTKNAEIEKSSENIDSKSTVSSASQKQNAKQTLQFLETTQATKTANTKLSESLKSEYVGGGPSSAEMVTDEEEHETERSSPLPPDFPRPNNLIFSPQADLPIDDGSGEETEAIVNKPQSIRFIRKTTQNVFFDLSKFNDTTHENFLSKETTPPIKILRKMSASKTLTTIKKNEASINRQQRDTSISTSQKPISNSAYTNLKRHKTHFVDLDINSPELTILDDDNLELGTAERLSALPTKTLQSIDNNQSNSLIFELNEKSTICISSVALALSGGFCTLLIIIVAFVLFKTRKTIHAFH